MPPTLALHKAALDHIGPQLAALNLNLKVITFDGSGEFEIEGARVPAAEVSIDYLWFSRHINSDGNAAGAFEMALSCRHVGVLQTFNAGLDDPFYATIAARGTRICNSSAQAVAISEYVFGQVLNRFQPLATQRQLQAARAWRNTPFREIWRTRWLIVGYGPIGQALAQRLRAFDATVDVVRRSDAPIETAARVGTADDLPRFLPDADVVVLACPLTAATRGMANDAFFAAVKKDAILVNIARGGLVEAAALTAALDSGRLGHAILDVFEPEPLAEDHAFWGHPGITVTAHTSFAGNGGPARWDQLFLENISRFAAGAALGQEVDPRIFSGG
ncbi:MAG: NAD(P)-dependent oxidoreductase [Pseudomonadota bacterium]|nr:NAD(P)-dependent oxidoreductase [Pseudomonadota bacterium]